MSDSPYSLPEVYELAFSFRDYPKACDFLTQAAETTGLAPINSVVELGCGPAQYAREFARRDKNVYGIDSSPEMIVFAQKRLNESDLKGQMIESDMRSFTLPHKVDLACCMMATFGCLLTNRDILAHLDSVADCLTADGVYIIELPHPRDAFDGGESTQVKWEMEKDDLKVKTDWGTESTFDPLTEIDDLIVRFDVDQDGKTQSHSFHDRMRRISAGLIRALIELSDRFRISAIYGDLDMNQPFDDSKKSWRMVLVLKIFS